MAVDKKLRRREEELARREEEVRTSIIAVHFIFSSLCDIINIDRFLNMI
jgi:hypothetical protein